MAISRAFDRVDMLDFDRRVGSMSQINDNLTYIELSDSYWYVYGDYRFPDDEWKGTIERIEVFGPSGDLAYVIAGLDMDASYAAIGPTTAFAARSAFKGNDRVLGSGEADRLAGFSKDDVVRGRGGKDAVFGNDGDDRLYGGGGGTCCGAESATMC